MTASTFLLLYFSSVILAQFNYVHNIGRSPLQTLDSGEEPFDQPPRIAIIGAGIAGASAAHHLHQMARNYFSLDMTVFEKEPRVGGQIRSTTLRHNPDRQTIELGGASFLEDDRCLEEAIKEVGLGSRAHNTRIDKRVGIWDGKRLAVSESLEAPSRKLQRRSLVGRLWDQVYSSRVRIFLYCVLSSFTRFQTCVDQKEKGEIAALRDAKPASVVGGNWRLPNRMLKISEARVAPNSPVKRISPGSDGKWLVEVVGPQRGSDHVAKTYEEEFDFVIITTPFEINNIELDPPSMRSMSALSQSSQNFVDRHVTHFTCKRRLASGYFNQPADSTLPEYIFTSPNATAEDFLISITIEDQVTAAMPGCIRDHPYFLYKATTTRAISNHDLADLFGEEDLTALIGEEIRTGVLEADADMDWINRQAWPHVGPISAQERTPGNIEIAPDLYYLPAGLQGPSTMEKSCQLGEKAAKQLFSGKLKKPMEMEM